MEAEKHYGPVWFLSGEKGGRYPSCNAIFIKGPNILIDPTATRERLEQIRYEEGVSEVWLSHVHEDHIRHLSLFADCPLGVSREDAPGVTDIELLLDSYGATGNIREYWHQYMLDKFDYHPRQVSHILQAGSVIDLGGITVDVIGTPGHTPGHLSFYFREQEILFLADYDLTKFGPWYSDRGSSIADTVRTIELLRKWPARVWMTSHEMGILPDNPDELWDNYLKIIDKREEKLLDLLAEPRTLQEIIRACIIYRIPRKPESFFDLGEEGHMRKHLEKLIAEKRVYREGNKFVRV